MATRQHRNDEVFERLRRDGVPVLGTIEPFLGTEFRVESFVC